LLCIYSAVAFYARDTFLRASHNSRLDLKHIIIAEFIGIRIISNFARKVRLY
jgi:hypothetical protein